MKILTPNQVGNGKLAEKRLEELDLESVCGRLIDEFRSHLCW